MQPDEAVSPPAWLANVVANMQASQDQAYRSALAVYAGAVSDWVTNNVLNRAAGRPLTPFETKPPQRVIIYATAANGLGQYEAPVEAGLPQPVLPPPTEVKTVPSAPILGPGSPNVGESVTLSQIYALLGKIAAVMGVK